MAKSDCPIPGCLPKDPCQTCRQILRLLEPIIAKEVRNYRHQKDKILSIKVDVGGTKYRLERLESRVFQLRNRLEKLLRELDAVPVVTSPTISSPSSVSEIQVLTTTTIVPPVGWEIQRENEKLLLVRKN